MASKTRQQLEQWVKDLKGIEGRVLDIGGAQQGLRGRVDFAGETKIATLDLLDPHEKKHSVDLNWDMNECLFSTSGKSEFEHRDLFNTFDHVFMLEVMEYIWNPVCAIKNAALFLRAGGKLYISFHFIYPQHNPIQDDFLRYTPAGAEKLLTEAGFEIIKNTPRVASSDIIYKTYSAEGMRGAPLTNHLVIGSLIEAIKK